MLELAPEVHSSDWTFRDLSSERRVAPNLDSPTGFGRGTLGFEIGTVEPSTDGEKRVRKLVLSDSWGSSLSLLIQASSGPLAALPDGVFCFVDVANYN